MSEKNNSNSSGLQGQATIGAGIVIKGEISGAEDLLVLGSIEGTVSLGENTVVVGESAKVAADINARVIRVEGQVLGNLSAVEQVVVHRSGQVRGNISAPRLLLEDGARLKGSIDTDCQSQGAGFSIEKIQTKAAEAAALTRAPGAVRGAMESRNSAE